MDEHGRSLVRKLEGKPFVIVGVNSDTSRDNVKEALAKQKITWRSFWDGGSTNGPIQNQWNVQAYPTMYLIDHHGIIVGRPYPFGDGAELIERMVKEAAAAQQK
jgi:hypothetical protein